MSYQQAFFSKLKECYLGVRIEGERGLFKQSGFTNLLHIKQKYFENIRDYLEKEELGHLDYSKLYDFFSTYLNETGTPFFYETPIYKNIYARVYSNSKDVSLFYKTQNLYYVKSDTIYKPLTLKDEKESYSFHFLTDDFIQNADNNKNKIIFYLQSIENNELNIKVINDKNLNLVKVFKQNSSEFSEDFLKALKKNEIIIKEEELKSIFKSYKKQNEIDFFIHKNAKAFLKEQFDLWFCRYVLDGVTQWNEVRIKSLNKVKKIAHTLIDKIAAFEDELKALWLKPKFAKKTHFVFSLDVIKTHAKESEELLKELFKDSNFKKQIKEWQDLKLVEEGFKLEDIKNYAFLPLDTKHLSEKNVYKLLSAFENLDAVLNGELVKADNFQALNSLLPKYQNKVDLIYIDPPYNTGNDGFIYTDKFNQSSWLSMMNNRLELAKEFLKDKGSIFISIDDNEQARLKILCDEVFGEENFISNLVWLKGNAQNDADTIQRNQEYILSYAKEIETKPIRTIKQEVRVKAFKDEKTGKFYYEGAGLTMGGGDGGNLENRPNLGYTFYYNPQTNDIKPLLDYDKEFVKTIINHDELYNDNEELIKQGYVPIRPPKMGAGNGRWKWALEKTLNELDRILIKNGKDGYSVLRKEWLNSKQVKKDEKGDYYAMVEKENPPKSFIDFVGSGVGTKELKELFNDKVFNNPKPEKLLKRICEIASSEESIVLDFFAGSGTTLATAQKLGRKWLGIEMGEHFYKVILPRLKKVIGGFESGISKECGYKGGGAFSYYELESYEEALRECEYKLDENHIIDYKKSRKLIKTLQKGENITLDMSGYEADFDPFLTLSNLYGWKIKKLYLDEKGVKTCEFENGEIVSLNTLDLIKLEKLKTLIWWE
ncbi:site-specific DNA-methyltransferase [Campylobacter vulpis]|uniref:site-specific DNA-methyltransferase n=1 Tax=Campylobacter vulpis TaxID=1655500 RepID=UPI003314AD44